MGDGCGQSVGEVRYLYEKKTIWGKREGRITGWYYRPFGTGQHRSEFKNGGHEQNRAKGVKSHMKRIREKSKAVYQASCNIFVNQWPLQYWPLSVGHPDSACVGEMDEVPMLVGIFAKKKSRLFFSSLWNLDWVPPFTSFPVVFYSSSPFPAFCLHAPSTMDGNEAREGIYIKHIKPTTQRKARTKMPRDQQHGQGS